MLNPKLLLKHFGIFWAVFIVLQLLISTAMVRNGLAGMHAAMFGKVAQFFLSDVKLKTKAIPEIGEIQFDFYSQLEVQQKVAEHQKMGGGGSNVQVTNYQYINNPAYHVNTVLAFLFALFLATPLACGRRFLLAGIGAFLFYGYSCVRMAVRFKNEISKMNIGLYESDPSGFFSLNRLDGFLSALGLIFIVVILIWALLVFSKRNIKEIKSELS